MKKFKEIDEEFICCNCNKYVPKLKYSSRNHCNNCLYSKHVDINPGDRLSTCKGNLIPIDIKKYKNAYKIIYKCNKCNSIRKNITAKDDNFDKILEIMSSKKLDKTP